MKSFKKLIMDQSLEIKKLKDLIYRINTNKIIPNPSIIGALLTGSVARGDGRIGPYGVMIDLAIIANFKTDLDLKEVFGPDEEPFIPFHCVSLEDKIGLAITVIEKKDLWEIRGKSESSIFAMFESEILSDKEGILKKWKDEYFTITEGQIKQRALDNFFRFDYLTNQYRFEKWEYRGAWLQIAQNFNEANECYCNFLFSINGMFIPRKDWLTYLTFEMENKPLKHRYFMNNIYESKLNKKTMNEKLKIYQEIEKWMKTYITKQNWL